MAKHGAKMPLGRRLCNLAIILLALCAAAGIFAGTLLSGDSVYAGSVIDEALILDGAQWLIPQENGGFLLLSTDGAMATKGVFLTQEGAVEENDDGYKELLGALERVFITDGVLYYVTRSAMDEETELTCLGRLPLDGSGFSGLEESIFNNTQAQLNLQTVITEGDGTFYAVAANTNELVRFAQSEAGNPVALGFPLAEAGVLNGLALAGARLYVSAEDAAGAAALYSGSLADVEQGVALERVAGQPSFPLQFCTEALAVDANGVLWEATADGLSEVEGAVPLPGGASATASGNLIGITSDGQIALLLPENLTSAAGYFQYAAGEIRAVASNGSIAALLYDGDAYRCVLLQESDLTGETESSSQLPSASESELDSELDSEESSESVSSEMTDSSEEGSEELLDPIASEPESSEGELSSAVDDLSSGDESADESASETEENAMLDKIVSTSFDVDSATGTVVLPSGTTLAQFRKTVPLQGATLSAVRGDGSAFSSGKLGTGMVLQLFQNGELADEVTVIVMGDLNGNGAINSADERLLYQQLTNEAEITGYYYTAADLDGDSVVDTRDLLLLKQLV